MSRLKTPVSFFKSITETKRPVVKDLQSFLISVSDFDNYDESLRLNYVEDKSNYDKLKKRLPGIVFGAFSERKDTACIEYSPCMGFDIDGIKDYNSVLGILDQIKKIDYVFAAFPSVSGHGIRILVFTSAELKTHKNYYTSIAKSLEHELELGSANIDHSTKNVSRLWYYSVVQKNEMYLNENSAAYEIETVEKNDSKSKSIGSNTIVLMMIKSILQLQKF